jgi:hypothetical protein
MNTVDARRNSSLCTYQISYIPQIPYSSDALTSFFSKSRTLELLPRPHIHNLQRRIRKLNHMPRLERLCINIIHVMGVEDARTTAVENGLFAWGVCEAETTPAVSSSVTTQIFTPYRLT